MDELFSILLSNLSKGQDMIYIGLGSAANLDIKKLTTLKPSDMHQYPPLVEKIKKQYNPYTHIVLIDPNIENPPYVVKYLKNKEWKKTYNSDSLIIYNASDINVYTCKTFIKYESGPNNIYPFLKTLNLECIKKNNLLLFHDFSGITTEFVFESFDKMLTGHKDKIIYDLTLRNSKFCYADLTEKAFMLPIEKDKYIRILNPYNIDPLNIKTFYKQKIPNFNDSIMHFIKHKIKMFDEHAYPSFRRINTLLTDFKNKKVLNKYLVNIIYHCSYFENTILNINTENELKVLNKYDEVFNSKDEKIILENLIMMHDKIKNAYHKYFNELYSIGTQNPDNYDRIFDLINQHKNQEYKLAKTLEKIILENLES